MARPGNQQGQIERPRLEYRNSAGRILRVLQAFRGQNGSRPIPQVAPIFGVKATARAVHTAIDALWEDHDQLAQEILQFKDNPDQYALFKSQLPSIEQSIHSLVIDSGGGSITTSVNNESVVALQFIAATMPKEGEVKEADIDSVRRAIAELRRQVDEAEDLTKTIREWLLELVRMMEDGLSRFEMRGGRGLRKELAAVIGEIVTRKSWVQEVKRKETLWEKLIGALDGMTTIANTAQAVGPLIEQAGPYLLTFLGS